MARAACALLAAGASRRLGRPKQLLTLGSEPLLRMLARTAVASSCSECAVVLGAYAVAIEPALTGLALTTLRNSAWEEGMASSIRAAVAWAREVDADVLTLCVCDQPALTSAHLNALTAAVACEHEAAASVYAHTLGVPAAFGRAWFERLSALRGDRGAGALLRESAEVHRLAWPAGALDLDCEHDLTRWQRAQTASTRSA